MDSKTKNVLPMFLLTCLATAVGELTLTTTPGEIKLGLTKTLSLDCSYKLEANAPINGLVAFFISRATNDTDASPKYEDIASINVYARNVSVFTHENLVASGEMSNTGVSHIHIDWLNPTDQQSGLYKCEAHGIDAVGHTIVLSNSSHVTATEPGKIELLGKLEEMDAKLLSMEQKFLELNTKLNEVQNTPAPSLGVTPTPCTPAPCCVQSHESGLCPLGDQSIFFPYNLTYNGHKYNIIRTPVWGADDAAELCRQAGSYLVEIEDQAEYHAISRFLSGQIKVGAVAIAGRYEHGQWSYQTSENRVGFYKWKVGVPVYPNLTDCITLTQSSTWMMEAEPCYEIDRQIYALCESNISPFK